MGVAAAGLVIGDVQISGDEARCHPEGTGGIDHQHRATLIGIDRNG
jgi:hypothetical protein